MRIFVPFMNAPLSDARYSTISIISSGSAAEGENRIRVILERDASSGALSGREALLLTLSNAYDLILMDQRMPEMDGTEAMKIIKAQEDGMNRSTPIICMTADAVIGAKERYLAEGFDDYLTKPVDSYQMKKLIMKRLPAGKVIKNADEGPAQETGE